VPTRNLQIRVDTDGLDADVLTEPHLYQLTARVVTTAHPFSEDDLRAFVAAGEHIGLE
jgi:hypothetical protein